MAAAKLLILLVVFSLVLVGIRADAELGGEIAQSEASDSPLRLEFEKLQTKIAALESSISDKTQELKIKDDRIAQMEKTIQEKSSGIISLQSEIELLQKKGSVDVETLVGKARARASDLEKQVEELKNEIGTQTTKKDDLEARASEAEKKLQELDLKLKTVEKYNDEQKRIIRKTERALQVAEEELIRAQLEATSKSKKLIEVHGAWLPPWLANLIFRCQALAATHWNEHGKPAVDVVLQKALEKSAQVQKWSEPHLETVKTKWIPVAEEQWITVTTYVRPYAETLSTKTIETYEICRSNIAPHILKVQELADPYFQEAKKFTKPHIDQIATFTKPHVEKVRVIIKPYTEHAVYAYGEFLKSTTMYHHQVQAAIHKKLENHELTKTLATKELVWFMASALLALPIFFLYRIFSAVFCKKGKKPTRNASTNHAPRRSKRRHADK